MTDLNALYERALITARSRGAMLIIDGPENASKAQTWRRDLGIDNPDVAAFAPRLFASNCQQLSFGAGGAIAGVMARTDQTRGVWKSPAGLQAVIRGSTAQVRYTEADVATLNQNNINPIRVSTSSNTPIVWGSRTMTSDPEWRYISVRRYFHFLNASIEKGTDWAVLEPNNAATWSAVTANIKNFMEQQFRSGALSGTSANDAYFTHCGLGQTMTQADIDNGIMRIVVGFAPLRPAEFVVFKISKQMATQR